MFSQKPKVDVIDVGCGHKPKGSINCDIHKPRKKVHDFVRCDAKHLPFRNKVSYSIISNNMLEHIKDAPKAFEEMKRVAFKVVVRADSLFSLQNWLHLEHEYITFKLTGPIYFVKRPNVLNFLPASLLEEELDRSSRKFDVLKKVGLIERWVYGEDVKFS